MQWIARISSFLEPLSVVSQQASIGKRAASPIWMNVPLVLLLVAISTLGAAAWLPLFDLDEGAFSEATREILASGNWISTTLNDEPRHDKPILIYWLQALSVSLFGFEPLFYRLPSIIASWCWIWVVFQFVKETMNARAAFVSVWLMVSSCLASVIFKAAIADALLNLWLCLIFFTCYRLIQHYINHTEIHSVLIVKLGVFTGFGFLTKGPIAVVLPGATCLISLLVFRQFYLCGLLLRQPLLWLTFIATILPWHIAVYLDQGMAFFEGFYLGHNLGRFNRTMENHGGSVLYYLQALPLLILPMLGLLGRYLFKGAKSVYAREFLSQFDHLRLLKTILWAWFLVTLLIFSFSKTQLPHYLLYGLVPIFILSSDALVRGACSDRGMFQLLLTRLDVILAFIYLSIISLLPWLLFIASPYLDNPYEHALVMASSQFFLQTLSWFNILILCVGIITVLLKKGSNDIRFFLLLFLTVLSFNSVLLPVVAKGQQEPVRLAAQYINEHRLPTQPLVAYKIDMPSLSVYTQRVIPNRKPRHGDWVFTRIDRLDDMAKIDKNQRWTTLFEHSGIILLEYGK